MASEGVSGSSGSKGASSAGNNGNAGKSDSKSSDDKTSKGGGSSKNGSDKGSFDKALSGASKNDKSSSSDAASAKSSNKTAATDKSTAHANEFSGLGSSGGSPTGNDSLNSHRGYGPDNSVVGGIDQDANAGLAAKSNQKEAAQNQDATDLVGPAGNGAAGLQGGVEALRDHVDRGARHSAAGTLTKGPGGNLPAAGYANRTDLGRALTGPSMTTSKALDATPFGPNAKSTQQLAAGAKTASNLGRVANGVGLGIQPAAGAIQGFISTPENASWTERATNTVIGAVKEFDDTGLSYGAGLGAGSLTVAGSVFTGPAAPVVAGSAPAVGVATAVGIGAAYNNSSVDKFFDGVVEDYGRPAVQGVFNAVDRGIDGVSGLYDRAFGDGEANGADN